MRLTLSALLIFVAACGSSSSNAPAGDAGSAVNAGGGLGAACVDQGTCDAGLFCFIESNQAIGKCTQVPAGCTGNECDCVKAAFGSQCTIDPACTHLDGLGTVLACGQKDLQAEGQPCSIHRRCAIGTYCLETEQFHGGTCLAAPAPCNGKATCACLEPEKSRCATGKGSCTDVFNTPRLTCSK